LNHQNFSREIYLDILAILKVLSYNKLACGFFILVETLFSVKIPPFVVLKVVNLSRIDLHNVSAVDVIAQEFS
jgi:hypothetical protein